jgi:predicted DNA-binding transcriptional regulator AlpA
MPLGHRKHRGHRKLEVRVLNDYLTAAELADYLRRNPAAVRRWVNAGAGPPAILVGKRRIWRRSEVDAWLSTLPRRSNQSRDVLTRSA